MGKLIGIVVIAVLLIGLFSPLLRKIPFLGRLPGDFHWRRNGETYSFPLASSLVLSIALTLLVNLMCR